MGMIKSTEENQLYRKTAWIADMGGKYNSRNSSKNSLWNSSKNSSKKSYTVKMRMIKSTEEHELYTTEKLLVLLMWDA